MISLFLITRLPWKPFESRDRHDHIRSLLNQFNCNMKDFSKAFSIPLLPIIFVPSLMAHKLDFAFVIFAGFDHSLILGQSEYFLLLRRLLLASHCVVVWVLFVIFCFTSSDNQTIIEKPLDFGSGDDLVCARIDIL